jgi:recombination protein RecA
LKRVKLQEQQYFKSQSSVGRIRSGCTLLDCVLGGGWAEGRIINIIGDKSTGKTLLAIEAIANFRRGGGRLVRYRDVEAAFDRDYALNGLGIPIEDEDFQLEEDIETVEDLYNDLEAFVDELDTDESALYILDSLDALSDEAEKDRDFGEATYGTSKSKLMSQLFRELVQKIEDRKITILIISQIRDNIGAVFGKKWARSGGKALDFYASQVVYLTQLGTIKKTKKGIERPVGINVRAKCEKNKTGMPFRECEFPIIFGYGVDDLKASIDWIYEIGREELLGDEFTESSKDERKGPTKGQKAYLKWVNSIDDAELNEECERVETIVKELWNEIEAEFAPPRRKYDGSIQQSQGR